MSASFPSLASQGSRAFPLPTISEDTLHYTLYLPKDADTEAEALAVLITDYVESLLIQPWLWNKDAWELKPVEGSKHALEGRMRVGDAVDDEWAVVWLMREVSKKWKDLVISIRDSDGEFLLIEAANELPNWVSPENAENRLWLNDGHLHLLPLSIRSSSSSIPRRIPDNEEEERQFDPENYLSAEDGVAAVRTGRYRAEQKMEDAVWERISSYPEALKTHQHRTKAWIPEKIAKALSIRPDLIQKAVEGFYVRDPAQLRAASRMTHFPPSPAILSSVLMTRAAYAQLQGQVFHPPRVFGPEWHVREGDELDNERRWRDIGVKIATGFEIMYREGGSKARSGHKDDPMSLTRQEPGYEKFITNLTRAGFFGNEAEGSEQWKRREEEAIKGWRSVKSTDTSAQRPSFAYQFDKALEASGSVDIDSIRASTDSPEDSDKWLEVDPVELDAMLQKASGGVNSAGPSEKAEVMDQQGLALGDLAKKVEEFVGGQGDIQGARFVDELSDEDIDGDSDEEGEEAEPELSAAQKEEMMQNLVAPLDQLQWGVKTQQSQSTQQPQSQRSQPSLPQIKKGKEKDDGPRMRPPIFEKQHFDGVESDSDDEDDETDLPPVGTLGRRIAEMKWGEGAPKIEEIEDDEEQEKKAAKMRKFDPDNDLDEKMRKKIWGNKDELEEAEDAPMVVDNGDDYDVDMGDEAEEFLKFTREALGIDEAMWDKIVAQRKENGDYVPEFSKTTQEQSSSAGGLKSAQHLPAGSASKQSQETAAKQPAPQLSTAGGSMNMDLDSFDKVMEAMDAELARAKGPAPPPPSAIKKTMEKKNDSNKSQAKVKFSSLPDLPTDADLDDLDDDDLEAMDRELRAALKNAGVDDLSDEEIPEVEQLDDDGKREYQMMKDFLESYKSQGGQSGVVGNLFGRLGEKK